MLSRKINLENLITEEDKKKIKKCSSLLSEAYNLCLDSLRDEIDFKKINLITKDFSKQNKIHSKVTQNTGRECINAVKSYLALKKKDPTARFPKNYRKYSPIIMDINLQKIISKKDGSIHYNICGGFSLYEKHIKIPFLDIDINLSNCDWYNTDILNKHTIKVLLFNITKEETIDMVFVYSEQSKLKDVTYNNKFISIDLGVSSIASIYTSDGMCYKYQTKRFKGLEKDINQLKTKLDKKIKGSNHYNKMMSSIKRKQVKITNKRKDYLHKTSKQIVSYCLKNNIDNIICGDIQTKKLKKDFKCKQNKSTQNEGLLSRFKGFLQYKAEKNNLNFILVDESYTTQMNCVSGKIEFNPDTSNRIVEICPNVFIDRDINSAVNIAKKYGVLWLTHTFDYHNLINVQKISVTL